MLTDLQLNPIIQTALAEDLSQGDITTDSLPLLSHQDGEAFIRVKERCIVSGLNVAQKIFYAIDPNLSMEVMVDTKDWIPESIPIAKITGCQASILKSERTVLNFLQHLSGIASTTRLFVEEIEGTQTKITHTRKTTPGLRVLEQQAVIDGGGARHRLNLGSAVMVKDNHIEAMVSITEAVQAIKERISHTTKIEVEVENYQQAEEALKAGADILLLDNMTPEQVKKIVDFVAGTAIIEVSGGITIDNVRGYAVMGVDIISTSQITLGAPSVDISLDFIPVAITQ